MIRAGLFFVALMGAVPSLATTATTAGTAEIHQEPATSLPPLFAEELGDARKFVDGMIAQGVVVPIPKDPGGGYTHEQHKRNYRAIYLGGDLYRITGEEKYRDYVRDLLLAYAEVYPTLGDHPARANQYTGRLFWQVLNDAVWLVHAVQGYEDIRETLSAPQRKLIDDQVFRRAVDFLSVDSRNTFDRIHNHATWATAGVGMTGYVLDDQDMVDRALLGSDKSGKTGFLRQTELLFSPDGYYAEGPYYQRYSIMPFMVFADSIARHDPNRGIFKHRDGILLKALRTTVQLTYGGYFFPYNDAIRDKSLNTEELYHGVAIAYAETKDPGLLSIAEWQGRTILSEDGLELARDLAGGKAKAFDFRSMLLADGPDGDHGAVAILRHGDGDKHTALVMKNSSQGMGHGHFDKLSWQLYDNGNEIVRDYGSARFLNIVAKQGGRYLPENESWAKQTIAHNTLVVDETSHFGGEVRLGELHAPTQLYFSFQPDLQVSSASISSAYPTEKVSMLRTLALLQVEGLSGPVVVDVLKGQGDGKLRFDLPLHFSGHIMETGFDVDRNLVERPVLGKSAGYQHIWVDGQASPQADKAFMTWLLDGRFYTYRFIPNAGHQIILAESGANDTDFNLRREPMAIQRVIDSSDVAFVSILEPHGLYDGASEQTVGSRSQIASMRHIAAGGYDLVIIETLSGTKTALAISYDNESTNRHSANLDGQVVSWTGFAARIVMGKQDN